MTATTADLANAGWARSFTGYWLAPNGQRLVSEADALQEVGRILYPEKESKR